ncbi:MAG: hypothetical protein ACP5P1_10560 [Acidimicrobiales bacterium]
MFDTVDYDKFCTLPATHVATHVATQFEELIRAAGLPIPTATITEIEHCEDIHINPARIQH